MRTRLILTIALTIGVATGCSSNPSSSPSPTAAPAAKTSTPTATRKPTPAVTPDDMTALVVDITWNQQTDADKDAMCASIAVFGPKWAAHQMQNGAGAGDASVDWDRAAVLVQQKCAQR